ncbi:MAG: hypothetical protein C4329_12445 [Chitinophagaceae bacterium]
MMEEIPENKIIVAMHNHDDNEWSISKFTKGKWKRNAKEVYINPELDEDDYYVTTDEYVFNLLKEKNGMLYCTTTAIAVMMVQWLFITDD